MTIALVIIFTPSFVYSGTLDYHVTFKITAGGTTENVDLRFKTDDTLHAGLNGFQGYLIDSTTLTGTEDGTPVTGLAVGVYPLVGNTHGYTPNDNLFNPTAGPQVDVGGLSFQDSAGCNYQLFNDNGVLAGECCIDSIVMPFTVYTVSDFQVVPEPSSIVLLGLGGLGFATCAYRRRRTTNS
jgi:hypothetical protein